MAEIGGEVTIDQDATSRFWIAADDEGRVLAMGATEAEVLTLLDDLAD